MNYVNKISPWTNVPFALTHPFGSSQCMSLSFVPSACACVHSSCGVIAERSTRLAKGLKQLALLREKYALEPDPPRRSEKKTSTDEKEEPPKQYSPFDKPPKKSEFDKSFDQPKVSFMDSLKALRKTPKDDSTKKGSAKEPEGSLIKAKRDSLKPVTKSQSGSTSITQIESSRKVMGYSEQRAGMSSFERTAFSSSKFSIKSMSVKDSGSDSVDSDVKTSEDESGKTFMEEFKSFKRVQSLQTVSNQERIKKRVQERTELSTMFESFKAKSESVKFHDTYHAKSETVKKADTATIEPLRREILQADEVKTSQYDILKPDQSKPTVTQTAEIRTETGLDETEPLEPVKKEDPITSKVAKIIEQATEVRSEYTLSDIDQVLDSDKYIKTGPSEEDDSSVDEVEEVEMKKVESKKPVVGVDFERASFNEPERGTDFHLETIQRYDVIMSEKLSTNDNQAPEYDKAEGRKSLVTMLQSDLATQPTPKDSDDDENRIATDEDIIVDSKKETPVTKHLDDLDKIVSEDKSGKPKTALGTQELTGTIRVSDSSPDSDTESEESANSVISTDEFKARQTDVSSHSDFVEFEKRRKEPPFRLGPTDKTPTKEETVSISQTFSAREPDSPLETSKQDKEGYDSVSVTQTTSIFSRFENMSIFSRSEDAHTSSEKTDTDSVQMEAEISVADPGRDSDQDSDDAWVIVDEEDVDKPPPLPTTPQPEHPATQQSLDIEGGQFRINIEAPDSDAKTDDDVDDIAKEYEIIEGYDEPKSDKDDDVDDGKYAVMPTTSPPFAAFPDSEITGREAALTERDSRATIIKSEPVISETFKIETKIIRDENEQPMFAKMRTTTGKGTVPGSSVPTEEEETYEIAVRPDDLLDWQQQVERSTGIKYETDKTVKTEELEILDEVTVETKVKQIKTIKMEMTSDGEFSVEETTEVETDTEMSEARQSKEREETIILHSVSDKNEPHDITLPMLPLPDMTLNSDMSARSDISARSDLSGHLSDQDHSLKDHSDRPGSAFKSDPSGSDEDPYVCVAIASYDPESDEVMSLHEGEKLEVLDDTQDDWWYVKKMFNKQEGWVPGQYLREKEDFERIVDAQLNAAVSKLPDDTSKG